MKDVTPRRGEPGSCYIAQLCLDWGTLRGFRSASGGHDCTFAPTHEHRIDEGLLVDRYGRRAHSTSLIGVGFLLAAFLVKLREVWDELPAVPGPAVVDVA